jgi:hypothetical protein
MKLGAQLAARKAELLARRSLDSAKEGAFGLSVAQT